MKQRLMVFVAAVFAAALLGCSAVPEKGSEGAFTLATFNIRGPFDRGDLVWSNRMPRVAQIIRNHGFDVFGVQEAVPAETPHAGPYNTFNGWKDAPLSRIDYIFSTPDVKVLSHATLNDKPGGEFASDHYPVAVSVVL